MISNETTSGVIYYKTNVVFDINGYQINAANVISANSNLTVNNSKNTGKIISENMILRNFSSDYYTIMSMNTSTINICSAKITSSVYDLCASISTTTANGINYSSSVQFTNGTNNLVTIGSAGYINKNNINLNKYIK